MASSKRITLVDPLGDILFSGDSMIAREADVEEPCPETKRSADSGMFPVVTGPLSARPAPPVTEAIYSDNDSSEEAVPTKKRDPRAA